MQLLVRRTDNGPLVLRGDVIVRQPDGADCGRKVSAEEYGEGWAIFNFGFVVIRNLPEIDIDFSERLEDGRKRYYVDLDAAAAHGSNVMGNIYRAPNGMAPAQATVFIKERV